MALLTVLAPSALLPVAASAYTAEQQQACTGDAFRFCSSEIPNIERITACMVRHKAELSPACRAHFPGGSAASGPGLGMAAADASVADAPKRQLFTRTRKPKKPAEAED